MQNTQHQTLTHKSYLMLLTSYPLTSIKKGNMSNNIFPFLFRYFQRLLDGAVNLFRSLASWIEFDGLTHGRDIIAVGNQVIDVATEIDVP